MSLKKQISHFFNNKGYEIVFRDRDYSKWCLFLKDVEYLPYHYTNEWLDYQNEYLSSNEDYLEISFILIKNDIPQLIFPLFFSKKNKKSIIKDDCLEIPLFSKDINDDLKSQIIKIILDLFFNVLSDENKNTNLKISDNDYLISNYLHEKYKICSQDINEYYVDTTIEFSAIKRKVRKSYKQFTKSSDDEIQFDVFTNDTNELIWSKFKNLHLTVSGRTTRSDKSWNYQFENLINNKSIFISASYNDKLISGAYFEMSKDELYYSVSCTDQKYISYKLTHKIMFIAIEKCIELNIKCLKLGNEFVLSKNPTNEDIKNYNISFFKKGFATHIVQNKKVSLINES